MNAELHCGPLWNEDGRPLIFPASCGNRGVLVGISGIERYNWIQPECLVITMLQIAAVFQSGECDPRGIHVCAKISNYNISELFVPSCISGKT